MAISFCNIEERNYLKDIQKLIDQKIPVVTKHPFADEVEEMPTKKNLKRTKDSDNKAIRSKDKRESKKNNSINNNEIRTFGESKNQNNNKFNSRRRNKKW